MSTVSVLPSSLLTALARFKDLPPYPPDIALGIVFSEGFQQGRLFLWPPLEAGPDAEAFFALSCVGTPDSGTLSVVVPCVSLQNFLQRVPPKSDIPIQMTTNGTGEAGLALSCGEIIDAIPAIEMPDQAWMLKQYNFMNASFPSLGSSGESGVYQWWGFCDSTTGPVVMFRLKNPAKLKDAMTLIQKLEWKQEAVPAEIREEKDEPQTPAEPVSKPIPTMGKVGEPEQPEQEEVTAAEDNNPKTESETMPEKTDIVLPPDLTVGDGGGTPPSTPPPPEACGKPAEVPAAAPTGKKHRRTAAQIEADRIAEIAAWVEKLKALGYTVVSPEEKAAEQQQSNPKALTAPPPPTIDDYLNRVVNACSLIVRDVNEVMTLQKAAPVADPMSLLKGIDLNALVLQGLEKRGAIAGEKK